MAADIGNVILADVVRLADDLGVFHLTTVGGVLKGLGIGGTAGVTAVGGAVVPDGAGGVLIQESLNSLGLILGAPVGVGGEFAFRSHDGGGDDRRRGSLGAFRGLLSLGGYGDEDAVDDGSGLGDDGVDNGSLFLNAGNLEVAGGRRFCRGLVFGLQDALDLRGRGGDELFLDALDVGIVRLDELLLHALDLRGRGGDELFLDTDDFDGGGFALFHRDEGLANLVVQVVGQHLRRLHFLDDRRGAGNFSSIGLTGAASTVPGAAISAAAARAAAAFSAVLRLCTMVFSPFNYPFFLGSLVKPFGLAYWFVASMVLFYHDSFTTP